jgi:hypothetical protein
MFSGTKTLIKMKQCKEALHRQKKLLKPETLILSRVLFLQDLKTTM